MIGLILKRVAENTQNILLITFRKLETQDMLYNVVSSHVINECN